MTPPHLALVLLLAGFARATSGDGRGTLQTLHLDYAWKKLDYRFPSDAARSEAIRTKAYDYTKILPRDVDVWEKAGRRKVFVSTPGSAGTPAALSTVSADSGPDGPLLQPYPDWSWHRKGDCKSITSVNRIAIDDYDRLWVADRGVEGLCRPKLLAFDLNTDRLLSSFEFGPGLFVNGSNLVMPVVDARPGGRRTFVYIADIVGGIVVYDHEGRRAWRVSHGTMLPEAKWSNLSIAGTHIHIPDGIFGMALAPLRCARHHGSGHGLGKPAGRTRRGACREDRRLYYHALASVDEHFVEASYLRDSANFRADGSQVGPNRMQTLHGLRSAASAAETMSADNVLFFGLLPDLALACWRAPDDGAGAVGQAATAVSIVAQDRDALQFPSGIKVRYGRLYVITNRHQRYATGTMDWSDVNFRVLSAPGEDLIRGSACDRPV